MGRKTKTSADWKQSQSKPSSVYNEATWPRRKEPFETLLSSCWAESGESRESLCSQSKNGYNLAPALLGTDTCLYLPPLLQESQSRHFSKGQKEGSFPYSENRSSRRILPYHEWEGGTGPTRFSFSQPFHGIQILNMSGFWTSYQGVLLISNLPCFRQLFSQSTSY